MRLDERELALLGEAEGVGEVPQLLQEVGRRTLSLEWHEATLLVRGRGRCRGRGRGRVANDAHLVMGHLVSSK